MRPLKNCFNMYRAAKIVAAKMAPQIRTARVKPPIPKKNVPTTAGVA